MKKTLLSLAFLWAFFAASAQSSCCLQVLTTKTNNPFACISTGGTMTLPSGEIVQLNTLVAGGNSYFSGGGIIIGNGTTTNNNASDAGNTYYNYGSEQYGYQGKVVRVFNVSRTNPDAQTNYVIDDDCKYVCSWSWSQVICVTAPCYPMYTTNCSPSFFTNSTKIP